MSEASPPGAVRRSRHLVAYWRGDGLRVENYATGAAATLQGSDVAILDACPSWTSTEALARRCRGRVPGGVEGRVAALLEAGLLESAAEEEDPRERAQARWWGWNPAAGFFHAATRDAPYGQPASTPLLTATERPPALKGYPEAARLPLAAFPEDEGLAPTLLARRTWRRFGEGPLALADLSALLGLTFGVQAWMGERRPAALKTSPSGGAKHSVEAYVLALDVEGVPPGTWHYDPDGHALERLAEGSPRDLVEGFLPAQPWCAQASALVFMTSVFDRVRFKYGFPRAYRVILLEAGHLAQTFLLQATDLGLAPFCTAALGDSAVEAHLGLDGLEEAALYCVGVGPRPAGETWAPWPEEGVRPPLHPPAHAADRAPEDAS